ncbi:hypothetical protein TNIN_294381 [Trichonephila inaurata madagascariensis]|uniref:Uncharacterized protein n=1 Tax=Trichonephila inaurata madagascariensis TaxID=2747483 RepID=A0A8X6XZ59_9ARAC|nr:hypothetical protein TNIN_294381 [Trichonephila inaurata madagascariensis]
MVMKNAVSGRARTDLARLYDELEGKLRALESLGKTQEKFGDFLAPPSRKLSAGRDPVDMGAHQKSSRTL